MSTYHVTYKGGVNYSGLPEDIDADGFRTSGRFVDFWREGETQAYHDQVVVHRIAGDAVVHIERVED